MGKRGKMNKIKQKGLLEYFLDGSIAKWENRGDQCQCRHAHAHAHTHTYQPHTVQTQRDILYKHPLYNTDMEVYADQRCISIVHGVSGRAACDWTAVSGWPRLIGSLDVLLV